jgi:tRNA(adenine34) deaminase
LKKCGINQKQEGQKMKTISETSTSHSSQKKLTFFPSKRNSCDFSRILLLAAQKAKTPFVVIIVNPETDQVLSEGEYTQGEPVAHGLVTALLNLTKKYPNIDRSKLVVYSVVEPSVLSIGALLYAGIHQLYFGAPRKNLIEFGWIESDIKAKDVYDRAWSDCREHFNYAINPMSDIYRKMFTDLCQEYSKQCPETLPKSPRGKEKKDKLPVFDHESFAKILMKEAEKSTNPFVSIIIDPETGKILATGENKYKGEIEDEPIFHSEIVALRNLTDNHPNIDRSNLVMLSTGEPCCMCSGGALYGGINHICFLLSRDELVKLGWKESPITVKEIYDNAWTKDHDAFEYSIVSLSDKDGAMFRRFKDYAEKHPEAMPKLPGKVQPESEHNNPLTK